MRLLVINTEGKMKESKKSLSEITYVEPVLRESSVLCMIIHVHSPKCELSGSTCYDNDVMVVSVLLTLIEMHEFVQCVACMLKSLID